jgi:thiol:disulfide interchange protein DsbA
MSIRNCTLTLTLGVLVAAAVLHATPAAAQLVENTDYRKVEPPAPTSSAGKIEVIEFFSYGCPHCSAFYPVISAWAAKLPKDVTFKRVPVTFNRPPWINVARAYYALQASGDLDRLDGKLFHAIHEEHLQLFDEQSLADWVGKNGGSAEKFASAYAAFGVNNQTVQADKMAEDYHIDSIPTLAVDGKFVAMADGTQAQDKYFVQILAHTDALIARVRAESPPAAAQKRK